MSKTFLELCQLAALFSGTIDGVAPTTVVDQEGRLAKVVEWTRTAWDHIQTEHITDWRWLRAEFEDDISANTRRYLPASFPSIPTGRFSRWITEEKSLTIYETAVGVSDERELDFIDWQDYRRLFERGTIIPKRPRYAAISPAGELCFGDTPDTTYTARGEFMKGKQTLEDDDDVPEAPGDYHEVIVWKTLMLLHEHDEAPQVPLATCRQNYENLMGPLRRVALGNRGRGGSIVIASTPLA